jgi:hypothetical protein
MKRSALLVGAFTLALTAWIAPAVDAEPFSYSNVFERYGTVANFFCPLRGICGADEIINSFVFLDNQYPSVYSGNVLIPGNDPNRDALWFAGTADGLGGWDAPNGPHRDGYYNRTGGDPDQRLLQTKQDWVNDWAPGTTRFDSMIGAINGFPTIDFLANEIRDHEDVELIVTFINTTTLKEEAHALGLTAISCDGATPPHCSIRYQDPNDPTDEKMGNLVTSPEHPNQLGFFVPAFNGNVFIRSALAESPIIPESVIPEPATWLLLATGLTGLFSFTWLRKRRLDQRAHVIRE